LLYEQERLDVIYLQAKRWEDTVGWPKLQKFVGALHGKREKKGVFITTGRFSDDAVKYVESIDPKVILIDGRTRAELMIDYGLGTTSTAKYEIKKGGLGLLCGRVIISTLNIAEWGAK
jgi:restriction system protein